MRKIINVTILGISMIWCATTSSSYGQVGEAIITRKAKGNKEPPLKVKREWRLERNGKETTIQSGSPDLP